MANFSANQSFSTSGLCETFTSTDVSDYTSNTEGYDESDINYKIWTFRNSSGAIVKQETVAANVYSCSIAISLLTFNITVDLSIRIKPTVNQTFSVSNILTVPCLSI